MRPPRHFFKPRLAFKSLFKYSTEKKCCSLLLGGKVVVYKVAKSSNKSAKLSVMNTTMLQVGKIYSTVLVFVDVDFKIKSS